MNGLRLRSLIRSIIASFLLLALAAILVSPVRAQTPKSFEPAAQAFEKGNFAEAERLLRAELARAPDDIFGLNLLAVSLDRQEKYAEAETVYFRALRRGRNATLLNNLANHYLAAGRREEARRYFEETLRLEPRHTNAHVQLAALDVENRRPSEALAHLRALPPAEQQQPAVILLVGRAQFQSGDAPAARATLAPLEKLTESDASVAFSLGVAYYQEKLYAEAVRAFEAALRHEPGNFDILYNLGLAYDRMGDKERSAAVLDRAVRVNARSADALTHLAVVMGELGHDEAATELLIRAREMAPERPELSLLLAHECIKQEFWLDAADAFESYLRLKPDDFNARKDLAYIYGQMKFFEQAEQHMDRYVAARPQDAEGFYLRGLIRWHRKRAEAATEDFRHALALHPKNAEAWARLGEIAREKNDLDEAARCYRQALEIQPDSANALYGLGQALNTQGRFREAVPLLKRAVEARPDEPAPHYQLSLAYRRLGQEEPARAALEKFQQLRAKSEERKYFRSGLVAYVREGMNLSESERRARELAYLERAAAIKAGDPALRARLIEAYVEAGKKDQAREAIRQWLTSDVSGQAELRVGEILLRHGDDEAALGHFAEASKHAELRFAAAMDTASAEFQRGRYAEALRALDSLTPSPEAAVEYRLLRAEILDKLQRFDEALASYQQALHADPKQEGAYLELGLFFVNHLAYDAALENFRAAGKFLPQSLKLPLAESLVLNLAGRRDEALAKLRELERRWPEQDWPYLLAGVSAYLAGRDDEARSELEKAAALGSTSALTYYYLGLLESQSAKPDFQTALRWADLALERDPGSALSHYLRGKVLQKLGRTEEARQSLEQAIRLQPDMLEAHFLLSRVCADLGDKARADAEAGEAERLRRQAHQVSPEKETILHLLVEVHPAGNLR